MELPGGHRKHLLWLVLALLLGCSFSSPAPPLTPAAAQLALDSWNPSHCKVVEFYGFHKPEKGSKNAQVAYVLLVNPGDQRQTQTIFTAHFQLLTRPNGKQQWFLTALTSHSSGLSKRQGWDNLLVPVKDNAAASSP